MNVLALDLGTNTGFAYNHGPNFFSGTWQLGTPKQIREWGKNRMVRRCDPRVAQLHWCVCQIFKAAVIDLIMFEDVMFCSTTYACQMWASLRAAVWLSGCPRIDCVPVQTLKQHATGRGNATKEQMIFAARTQRPDLKFDADSADAFHLWTWAQKHIKI